MTLTRKAGAYENAVILSVMLCHCKQFTWIIIDDTHPDSRSLRKCNDFVDVCVWIVLVQLGTLNIIDLAHPGGRSLRKCNDFVYESVSVRNVS